jgi:hypothetical protein
MSDILFFFSPSLPCLFFLRLLLYYDTTISFHSSLSLFVISYYFLINSHTTPFVLFHFFPTIIYCLILVQFFFYYLHMLTHTSLHFQVMLSRLFSFSPYRYVSSIPYSCLYYFYSHALLFSGCFPFTFTYHFNLCRVVPEGQR